MKLAFGMIDGPCPTVAEIPDEMRHRLPLITWCAVHRTLRAGSITAHYDLELARIETEGLVEQSLRALRSPNLEAQA